MKPLSKKLIVGIFIASVVFIAHWLGIHKYFTLSAVRTHSLYLQNFVQHHYISSVLLYLTLLITIVSLSIPLSILMNITSGFLFGVIPGTLYSIFGATTGAVIGFITTRYLLYESIHRRYGHALYKFNTEIKRHGASYLLFMQLLPITPFAVITILSSLSDVSLKTFAWTTAVGIIPGTLVYTYAGRQLTKMVTIHDIMSWQIMLPLMLLALFSLIPVFVPRIVQWHSSR